MSDLPGVDPLIDLAQRQKTAVQRRSDDSLRRIVSTYTTLVKGLQDKIDALMLEIEASDDEITPGQAVKLVRYNELIVQAEEQLQRYTAWLQVELSQVQGTEIAHANNDAQALLRASSTVPGVDPATPGTAGVDVMFNRLPVEAIERIVDYTAPGSPLDQRLQMLAPGVSERVADAFVQGLAMGRNPRVIARQITDAFGIGLTESMKLSRTLQIWTYREVTRANYAVNTDVLEGWYWMSALDPGRTCMSCVNMHGTFHTMDETLNDHYNGLCTMLPAIKGRESRLGTGEDWFASQPESVQRTMLGNKYDAWSAGDVQISQMTTTHSDDIFGVMRTEASLKNLTGN